MTSPKKASPKKAASPAKTSPKKASPSKKAAKKTSPKAAKKTAKADKADKPKRAPSAFINFSTAKRGELKTAHPEWKIGDIAKELGIMWSKLTDAEKASYKK